MKKMKENKSALIVLILEFVIGILLVAVPEGLTGLILMALGAMVALGGIAEIVGYFREEAAVAAKNQTLTKGLCMLIGGAVCAMKSAALATFLLNYLFLVYGALMLAAGLSKLQSVLDILRMKGKKWYIAAINAALTLGCAALVLLNPKLGTKFIGAFLVVEAVLDLVALVLRVKKFEKKPQQPQKVEEPKEKFAQK